MLLLCAVPARQLAILTELWYNSKSTRTVQQPFRLPPEFFETTERMFFMKMIRKWFPAALTAAVCAAGVLSLRCAAEGSVEDVYAAMRRIGMPETMIQEAKTQYMNAPHDENGMEINGTYQTYDIWAETVELCQDAIWDKVGEQFGVSGSDIREKMNQNEDPASSAGDPEPQTPAVSVPAPEKPFVNMTLTEKQDYVKSLPEEQRASFLASMSKSERNSVIKQMDTGSQADIVGSFVDLGEQFGMHISVDQLDGNGINYAVRNGEGELIDANSVSAEADDTGWDMTVPVLGSGLMMLAAVGGLSWLSIRNRKQEAADG